MSYSASDFFDDVGNLFSQYDCLSGTVPEDFETEAAEYLGAIRSALHTRLDSRELGTVLAALRYWQASVEAGEVSSKADHRYGDIAANGGDFKALTVDEIDELCERINV